MVQLDSQSFEGLDVDDSWLKLSQKVEPKNDILNGSLKVLGTRNQEQENTSLQGLADSKSTK